MKSLQNLSFVSDISTDASIDEMISILKYNRTVASDMARQNAYLKEANARISNFQAKHGEQELECQEKVDTNQENLEDLYTMFYKPILDLEVTPALKQDIIELLPDRKSKYFYSIVGRIKLELLKAETEYLELFRGVVDDHLFLEELQKEIASYREKNDIISNYLTSLQNENLGKDNISEEVKSNQLIYLPTPSGNLYVNNDLLAIPTEYYSSFYDLFLSIQNGTFKNLKRLNRDSIKKTSVVEVKDYQSRIVFDRIGSNRYIILSTFVKKVDWNNENRLSLINRVDMYRSIENRLSTLVHDEEFMKSQEEITKDIFEALKNNDREKIKALGRSK